MMNVGTCGICCDVCGLIEKCTPCGSAQSEQAKIKMEGQLKLLGNVCPFLSCAREKGYEYCQRDCSEFPCEKYRQGPYPYSENFCAMYCKRKNM